MLNSRKTQMTGHTSSGEAVLIGGKINNEIELNDA
jgi:hypothetical protein